VGELLRDHIGRPRLVALGAPILAVAGILRGSPAVRLAALAALAGLLATVTVIDPFRHWNRYQIPALPPLLVAAVAGVPAVAGLARSGRGRTVAAGLLSAALLGSQVSFLAGYNDLFAYNCRDIHFQQVHMGAWMREHLPAGTPVAVHDAGAIPLLSRLPVLDLLGLGTPGFPEAWREGEGALYEALERLPPGRRPRFFAVYARWVPLPDLFGRVVHRIVLDDNRTCGDAEKVLFEARWDVLGGGDRPLLSHPGVIVDEVDVADLESERAHDYAIDRPSRTIYRREPTEGRAVSDGGRVQHAFESMRVAVTPGRDARLVWRTDAWIPARIRVLVDGTVVARLPLSEVRAFIEPEVLLPGSSLKRARPVIRVEQEGQGEMSSFHYWVLQ
jgi:hypothetical protein